MKRIQFPAILILLLFLFSCKKYRVEYDQPSQVEFKPITANLAKGTSAAPGSVTILVQLVGPQRDADVNVEYVVDPASTAVSGTHYTILGTIGKITIPAHSSSAQIVLTAIPANLDAAKKLILTLKNGALPVSSNYKTSTITLQ
ncbi:MULTISPECIES: hypothetical protein [unclassified Pedobacter]|uniref:hypothetical protein n=1 Tax=unclassified Pedobacter TaxID=2628915 RepID=UPI0014231425|nr:MULTISPECIES: hypothetical protein [unclassified Pedobacter]NII81148.1 hypothetical protein [Pedobacter sp. SG908]NMN35165.1 hypothetical protein [Pedobacter sp. SG918]